MCKCCPSLKSITYSFTDKHDGRHVLTRDRQEVRNFGKLSHGVTGFGICQRCGSEQDFEFETAPEFIDHCDLMDDPL